jgi:chaperonin GroES
MGGLFSRFRGVPSRGSESSPTLDCSRSRGAGRELANQTVTYQKYEKDQMEEIPMQVRPLHDRVLVKRFSEEEKSKGGIIIPDTAKEKPIQGEVIAVGQGRIGDDGKVRPLDVKKGDRVLFGKYSGTEIKIEGDEFLMMREEDILGVLTN